jgi:hypothetical protein
MPAVPLFFGRQTILQRNSDFGTDRQPTSRAQKKTLKSGATSNTFDGAALSAMVYLESFEGSVICNFNNATQI